MKYWTCFLVVLFAFACGDDDGLADGGTDVGAVDAPALDAPMSDAPAVDAPAVDAPVMDASADAPTDSGADAPPVDAATPCTSDEQCTRGEQWCVGGECVECSNDGLLCDIACDFGWQTYERNGCFPCECAPTNACTADADCEGMGGSCYAGAFCTDWCPAGDPSCCFGNVCSQPGCGLLSTGCKTRGCPQGEQCMDLASLCAPSFCGCSDGSQVCTADCSGGSCVAPE